MIFGIGTDIVKVARIQSNLDKYGDRFAHRILTDEELLDFNHSARKAHFVAKRFAAKEALVKAMGTGFREGIQLRHIRVNHDDLGKPVLECRNSTLNYLQDKGICSLHLSLSDERDYAVAFVVLER